MLEETRECVTGNGFMAFVAPVYLQQWRIIMYDERRKLFERTRIGNCMRDRCTTGAEKLGEIHRWYS